MDSSSPSSIPLSKKLIFTAVVIVATISCLLGIGESACRVVIHFKHGVPGKSYGIYQGDKELGATHRPNSYNSNSVLNNWGLRNTADVDPVKAAGSMRIYCSGGSTTFCYNLDTDDAWPSVLERRLRKTPGREHDQVLNAGQISFSTAHEFTLARRQIPQLKPDVVLLFAAVNEGLSAELLNMGEPGGLDRLYADKAWGVPPRNLDQARFWKRNSALVRLWDYKIKAFSADKATAGYHDPSIVDRPLDHPSQHPYVMENLDKTLRAYIKFVRDNNATPVLIRFGDNGDEEWYFRFGLREWRERAVKIAREEGVVICDAAAVFEKHPQRRDCFISSGVHVTTLGAEVLANELEKTLSTLKVK